MYALPISIQTLIASSAFNNVLLQAHPIFKDVIRIHSIFKDVNTIHSLVKNVIIILNINTHPIFIFNDVLANGGQGGPLAVGGCPHRTPLVGLELAH